MVFSPEVEPLLDDLLAGTRRIAWNRNSELGDIVRALGAEPNGFSPRFFLASAWLNGAKQSTESEQRLFIPQAAMGSSPRCSSAIR